MADIVRTSPLAEIVSTCPQCGQQIVRYFNIDKLRTEVCHGEGTFAIDIMYLARRKRVDTERIIDAWLASLHPPIEVANG